MSLDVIVFMAGLFGVPLALLAIGHRLRRRSHRVRAIFWGAIAGHCVAAIVAVIWAMIPPEAWTPAETGRGFAGLWSLLVFPVVGAALFALSAQRRAALAVIAAPILVLQQSAATLVPVVGNWSRVDDGGPALRVDGATWSGKTVRAEVEAAARPIFGGVSDALIANATSDGAFPLAVWTGTSDLTSGTVTVQFKLIAGPTDQSAGIVLGLQPTGEYYFVRYNTKDGNVAVWRYEKGGRKVLTHGEVHQQLPLNQWHELIVRVSGRSVVGSVTGTRMTVEHTLDQPLTGRVGLWAKRDVVTAFRNFAITP